MNSYWSTGIHVSWRDDQVFVSADYLDDGFCDPSCTEGHLRLRYWVDDLPLALDTLKAAVEALGITWVSPHLYVPEDGENPDTDLPDNWQEVLATQSKRLGWEPLYTRQTISL